MERLILDSARELTAQTPRPVRYTEATRTTRLLLLLLFLGGVCLVTGLAARDLSALKALRAAGRTATANIVGRHVTRGKSDTYVLDYVFEVGGDVIYGDEDVSERRYTATHVGDGLLVTYLPADPETHRVGSVTDERLSRAGTVWACGVMLTTTILGMGLGVAETHYRRQRVLLRDGAVVIGVIVARRAVAERTTTYSLTYEYPVPGRDLLEPWQPGRVDVSKAFYDRTRPDQPVTLLYLAGDPPTCLPYQALTAVELAS